VAHFEIGKVAHFRVEIPADRRGTLKATAYLQEWQQGPGSCRKVATEGDQGRHNK